MGLITIKEYAAKHDREPDTIKKSCQRGRFKTAQKIGRDWLIDEDEPFIDHRIKSRKYIKMKED